MVGSSTHAFGESSTTPGYRGSEDGGSLLARRGASSGNREPHGSCLILVTSEQESMKHCIVYESAPQDDAYDANIPCATLRLSRSMLTRPLKHALRR